MPNIDNFPWIYNENGSCICVRIHKTWDEGKKRYYKLIPQHGESFEVMVHLDYGFFSEKYISALMCWTLTLYT